MGANIMTSQESIFYSFTELQRLEINNEIEIILGKIEGKKNFIIAFGMTSSYDCFLNVHPLNAIEQYATQYDDYLTLFEKFEQVIRDLKSCNIVNFDDTFYAYEIGEN